MVAEKPSLALSLSKIIAKGQVNSRKGFNGACSVHEFVTRFPPTGEQARFKFTSVCGHVMSLDFIGKYNSWDKVDPAELFQAPTQKKEASPNLHMPGYLEKEAKGCDFLVLWLDCDKEGENICFEVIDAVNYVMTKSSDTSIYRAKFSAITETDVMKAFNNLGFPNKNEAMSVDARQELDLRIGCAFTRYQTKFFQGKYGDLDSTLISFGPCQTPTLGFCVERHDKIESFKPEPYWVIHTEVTNAAGKTLSLDWNRGRIFDKEVANLFLNMVKGHSTAKLTDVQKKEKAKPRPLALNTVEMLRVASSGLGMSPQHTMQIAERLYTQGYISYPRTETNSYPENFDLVGTLRQQQNSPDWGAHVREILANGINRPKKGHDAGDHPPITPMKSASEAELGNEAWKLYDYITRHFIATLSSDCTYLLTTFTFTIGDEIFTCSGKTVIDPGYTTVMPWQAIPLEETMPVDYKIGETWNLNEIKLVEKLTCPPDYLTESELITLMEKHGIGTDASIPVHINNICERNYVTVISGRRLKPTTLGIVLVHGYQKIDLDLVKPTMRAAVEEQLNLIAAGKANFEAVLQHAIDIFNRKFKYFVENILSMDELFEVSFSPLASSGKPLARCGKCRRYMKFIQAKPTRLHCGSCDETFNIPQNGNIKLYKELRCPLDDYELLYCTTGTQGKGFILCPYCYNNPPFKEMKKSMGCNECTHPSCQHSLTQTGVSSCNQCEFGMLILDLNSAPKWKIVCNKCNVVVNILENAHKVTVTENACEDCQSAILEVQFKNKSPLSNEAMDHTGCIFCDPLLVPLLEMKFAKNARPMNRFGGDRGGRGGRGRGGGGGRGGRGRGRGKPKDKMAQLASYFV